MLQLFWEHLFTRSYCARHALDTCTHTDIQIHTHTNTPDSSLRLEPPPKTPTPLPDRKNNKPTPQRAVFGRKIHHPCPSATFYLDFPPPLMGALYSYSVSGKGQNRETGGRCE